MLTGLINAFGTKDNTVDWDDVRLTTVQAVADTLQRGMLQNKKAEAIKNILDVPAPVVPGAVLDPRDEAVWKGLYNVARLGVTARGTHEARKSTPGDGAPASTPRVVVRFIRTLKPANITA
ncbi:hypothetical protein GGR53DRAFT_470392 [Hypoxylon sp. FL1150]|nr:hypothetical protein GGR53DRAFT_470392 [Hypoxylon sp. FL1150]